MTLRHHYSDRPELPPNPYEVYERTGDDKHSSRLTREKAQQARDFLRAKLHVAKAWAVESKD